MDAEGREPLVGRTLRQWTTAADIANDDSARTRQWGTGRKLMVIRLVLLALGHTAACTGSMVVSTGPEQLALLSGTQPEAAEGAVQALLDDDDPLIIPAPGPALPGTPACWLRVPQSYREEAEWRRRRAESITPTHPVFLVLGPAAGFTYSGLCNEWEDPRDVAEAAKLSHGVAGQALRKLQEHGLAVSEVTQRTPWESRRRCWRFSQVQLGAVARETGAFSLYEQRLVKYAGGDVPVRWPYIPGPLGHGGAVPELAP